MQERERLVGELAATFRTRDADQWLARLDAHGVPAGKVRGVREAFEAAAAAGDPASVVVNHPTIGELSLVRGPVHLIDEGAAQSPPAPPPLLGEHTAQVLGQLGIDAGPLIAAGVAAGPAGGDWPAGQLNR